MLKLQIGLLFVYLILTITCLIILFTVIYMLYKHYYLKYLQYEDQTHNNTSNNNENGINLNNLKQNSYQSLPALSTNSDNTQIPTNKSKFLSIFKFNFIYLLMNNFKYKRNINNEENDDEIKQCINNNKIYLSKSTSTTTFLNDYSTIPPTNSVNTGNTDNNLINKTDSYTDTIEINNNNNENQSDNNKINPLLFNNDTNTITKEILVNETTSKRNNNTSSTSNNNETSTTKLKSKMFNFENFINTMRILINTNISEENNNINNNDNNINPNNTAIASTSNINDINLPQHKEIPKILLIKHESINETSSNDSKTTNMLSLNRKCSIKSSLESEESLTCKQQQQQQGRNNIPLSQFNYRSTACAQPNSLSPTRMRRYSIIEENMSDKFWVPEEIAINSQQRSSLPFSSNTGNTCPNNNTSTTVNEAFNQTDTSINSMENSRGSIFDRRESIPMATSTAYTITNNTSVNNGMRRQSTITSTGSGSKGRRASMFDPIDPTELQKTLYQSQANKENTTHIESTATDNVGMVEIGLEYMHDTSKLMVDIIRCFDLQPKYFSDIADPYCKCTLMPDKLSLKTKVSRKTLNPIFEETFEFELERDHFESRYLIIEVFDYDKFSKDECIGYFKVALNNVNFDNKKILLKELKQPLKLSQEEDLGDLMFSLAYLPSAERLTIVIMKARNLKGLGITKKTPPDPFVKICLQSKDGKKYKKKKTSTQKYTMNPEYNEEIVFTNVSKDQLNELEIKLMVFHDSITSRELLGYVELSSSSKGDEYDHWKDMIDGKKSIGWWHQMKSYPYVHKNSLSNVLSYYHNHHSSHQSHFQKIHEALQNQNRLSSNDDIEDACDVVGNHSVLKNLNEATIKLASLVLAPQQQLINNFTTTASNTTTTPASPFSTSSTHNSPTMATQSFTQQISPIRSSLNTVYSSNITTTNSTNPTLSSSYPINSHIHNDNKHLRTGSDKK